MELVKNYKQIKLIKKIFITLLATVVLAVSSKISIPFYPVPMTMQTMVVLLIGINFGWRLGFATIALYLLEGLIGLPVFSGTPEKGIGLVYFNGPTMGYLLGFLVTVIFVGKFNYNKSFFINFIKLTFATSFIYILGMFWLGVLIGWDKPIYKDGAEPFLLAELFKILLVTIFVTKFKKAKE